MKRLAWLSILSLLTSFIILGVTSINDHRIKDAPTKTNKNILTEEQKSQIIAELNSQGSASSSLTTIKKNQIIKQLTAQKNETLSERQKADIISLLNNQ